MLMRRRIGIDTVPYAFFTFAFGNTYCRSSCLRSPKTRASMASPYLSEPFRRPALLIRPATAGRLYTLSI